MMSEQPPTAEYLVISRGQWDETLSRDEIQNAIDQFYIWYNRLIDEGKMKRGNGSRMKVKRSAGPMW